MHFLRRAADEATALREHRKRLDAIARRPEACCASTGDPHRWASAAHGWQLWPEIVIALSDYRIRCSIGNLDPAAFKEFARSRHTSLSGRMRASDRRRHHGPQAAGHDQPWPFLPSLPRAASSRQRRPLIPELIWGPRADAREARANFGQPGRPSEEASPARPHLHDCAATATAQRVRQATRRRHLHREAAAPRRRAMSCATADRASSSTASQDKLFFRLRQSSSGEQVVLLRSHLSGKSMPSHGSHGSEQDPSPAGTTKRPRARAGSI